MGVFTTFVRTTQAAFIQEPKYHSQVPTTSHNFGAKNQKQALRVHLYKSESKGDFFISV